MIKVSVTSTAVRRMTGNAKATGKPYDMSFQDVWMHLLDREGQADPYPTKVEIILPKDKDGAALFYAPGEYFLHPSSIYVDNRGGLSVAPKLAKAAAPAPKSAA
ncbi:single-stranded DNA-binding protein [Variovorax saccharolyticus]|uniref:single-stranded DNA-binding protein n=1 Tax=Variovorax saccharolyticus TaxID=3053516 RepID=UPI00257837EA|nr:single-stranded DNA-binding protein [Variovorax sp. J31P216]MDM0027777.1 single-stranded DNA-binding protein [Variovorax sp. J31P216]